MNWQQAAPIFRQLMVLADQVSRLFPGNVSAIAQIVASMMRFAEDLARKGISPAEHLEKIHAADPDLQSVEDLWAHQIRQKFSGP